MREYGKVHATFWSSPTLTSVSDDARLIALYLLTCTHNTIAGVFRLPDGYVAEDLNWSTGRVKEALDELLAKGFLNRCPTTKWIWIVRHFKWNPLENPNQRKAAAKVAQGIPQDCTWRAEYFGANKEVLGLCPPTTSNRSVTVAERSPNQEQEQEQEQEQDLRPRAAGAGGFDRFWAAWPKHTRKVALAQCRKKWEAKDCEAIADRIVAHVESMKRSEQWQKDGAQFIPAPLVYLTQERWIGAIHGSESTEWFETAGGIKAKGAELGMPYRREDECRDFAFYKTRVVSAAGLAPGQQATAQRPAAP